MKIENNKLIGKGILILLFTSLFLLFGTFQGNIITVQAASGTFDEDFTTTTNMDGSNTNASGWGTGSIENARKKPSIVGSLSSIFIGNTIDVFAEGSYAYVTNQEDGLKVVNITDPTNPNIVGSYATADIAQSVFVEGNFAYITDFHGDDFWVNFQVVDVTDPTNPIFAGNCSTFDYARAVAVDGSYAYVANSESGLSIIDISDPYNPSQIRIRDTAGTSFNLAIDGDYVYLADGANGLVVIDVSNPLAPTIIATFTTGISSAIKVVIKGIYAYVVDQNNGIVVVNISDPTTPVFEGSWSKSFVSDADVYSDYIYVTDINDGLTVVNITDPTNPKLINVLSLPGNAQAVFIDDIYVYLTCVTGGFQVAQIADFIISVTGSYVTPSFAEESYVSGDFVYVAAQGSGLQVLNISVPSSPVLAGSYDEDEYANDVVVFGDYAYVADHNSGLLIINIADPSSPTLAGSCTTTPGYATSVFVSGNYAYIADGGSGLQIVNITDPSSPTLTGSYTTPGTSDCVFVSGAYAYVADWGSGLQIINITDPSSPTLAGSYDTPGYAEGVYVSGAYAYVADFHYGLQVLDVTDPSSPTLAGSYNTPGNAADVVVSDAYAYVADWDNGLQVLDVTDPSSPTLVGSYNTPGSARGIFVSGAYVYLADLNYGLQIIEPIKNRASQYDSPCFTQSNIFFSASSAIIASATLTAIDNTPTSTLITYSFSADGGSNWETITPGIEHIFSNTGYQFKWKANLITTDILVTPVIDNISIDYVTKIAAPPLDQPIDGAITDDYTPTFTWSSIDGETNYLFQLDNTTSFTSPLLNVTLPSSSTSYDVSSALAPDTYYWRVVGIDSENDIGVYSNYRTIYIIDDTNAPTIDSPTDVTYEVGEIGNSITWNPSDTNPYFYNITRNTTLLEQGISWDGGSITIDVDGLTEGVYNFTCYVYDQAGLYTFDSVIVTVEIPVIGEFTYYSIFSLMFITATLIIIYSKKKRIIKKRH